MQDKIKGAILGATVGDALGVPFEFKLKQQINMDAVDEMNGFGTYNQPEGTWSDDTSMFLCNIDSLTKKGYDLEDIGKTFVKWLDTGYLTPHGNVFDCGRTVRKAITKIRNGYYNGCHEESNCGNGSLMRILPMAFYLYKHPEVDRFQIIKEVSSLTHSNMLCIIGCAIYTEIALNLLQGQSKEDAYKNMQQSIISKYENDYGFLLKNYTSILSNDISKISFENLSGKGYIVDTLESSLYCFFATDNYRNSVLKAVSIGMDTDTVASITGGLSGLCYGYENIPTYWLNKIVKKDMIENMCNDFSKSLNWEVF